MLEKVRFRQSVKESIKRVKELDDIQIDDDETFADFGLDSLDGMDMVLNVEADLGIDLGEFDLGEANTINRFYEKACEILGGSGSGD